MLVGSMMARGRGDCFERGQARFRDGDVPDVVTVKGVHPRAHILPFEHRTFHSQRAIK